MENDYLAALAEAAPEPSQKAEAAASPDLPPAASAPPSQDAPLLPSTQLSDWVPTSQAVLEVAHPVATAYAEACDGRGLAPVAGLLRALATIPPALVGPPGSAPLPPPYGAALVLRLPAPPPGAEHEDGGQAGALFAALLGG